MNEKFVIRPLFEKYQKELVAFANTSYGRDFVSQFGGNELKMPLPIVKVAPDGIHQQLGDNIYRAVFYPKSPYVKLFAEILTMMELAEINKYKIEPKQTDLIIPHFLGETNLLKNKLPKIYLASSTFNPDAHPETTSVDGRASQAYGAGAGVAWATIIAAGGNGASDNDAAQVIFDILCDTGSNTWRSLTRSFFLFDTSTLGSSVVLKALMSVSGDAKDDPATAITPTWSIYETNPASNTQIVAGDFDAVFGVALSNNTFTFAGTDAGGYNGLELNSLGLSKISTSSITKFGIRNTNYDTASVAPNWTSGKYTYVDIKYADNGSLKPKLTVTYTRIRKSSAVPKISNAFSASLDGSTDAFSIADHSDFKPTGNFTVGAWIKTGITDTNRHEIIGSSNADGSKSSGIDLEISTGHKARFVSQRNSGFVQGTDYQEIVGATQIDDGRWRWIVATWDGSNLNLYVNGLSDATAVAWANAPVYNATNYVRIGCIGSGGSNSLFFNGNLDEVFLVNGTAWTAAQVASYYKTYLDGATNLKAYYKFENNANDSSGNSHNLTDVGTPTYATNNSPFNIDYQNKVAGVTGTSQELYNTALFADGNLQSYWRLEGNSNDAKGANNGTDTSITYGTAYGRFNQGATFNGSSSKIIFGDVLDVAASAFSIGCWVMLNNNYTNVHSIISKGTYNDAGYIILVDNGTATTDSVGVAGLGKASWEVGVTWGFTTMMISPNVWHHLVYVRSISGGNETNDFYVDGVLDGTYTRATQNTGNNNSLMFGARDTGGAGLGTARDFLNGSIDEPFFFDRALTAAEIINLYSGSLSKFIGVDN